MRARSTNVRPPAQTEAASTWRDTHRERERSRGVGVSRRRQRPREPDGEGQRVARVHSRERDEGEPRGQGRPVRARPRRSVCRAPPLKTSHESASPRPKPPALAPWNTIPTSDATASPAASTPKIRRSLGRTGVPSPGRWQRARSRRRRRRGEARSSGSACRWTPCSLPGHLVVLQHLRSMTPARVALRASRRRRTLRAIGCESAETIRQATVYVPRASGRSSNSIRRSPHRAGRPVPSPTRFASES